MREYNQGDAYMEYQEDEGLEYDESGEVTDSEAQKIFGMPVKMVVLGGAAVLAVLLGLLFLGMRKKPEPEALPQIDSEQVQALQESYEQLQSAQNTESPVLVYDEATGMWVNGDTGTTQQKESNVELSSISEDDKIRLRQLGYTGDEIEFALGNGFDVQGLIEEVEKLYDKEADDALRRMSDSASEEFKYIVDNTYFSQPGYEFVDITQLPFGEADYYHGSYIVNADYKKCPTYGAQLQLKCKVSSDLEVFYIVTPERFASLPESGNIVIEVFYTVFGSAIYVTDIIEPDKTVNPIDNTTISQEALIEFATPTEHSSTEEAQDESNY